MTAVEELLSKLLHPARLLLIESDKRQAEALKQQIQQKYECTVDWVATCNEAKHRVGQQPYDLLLLEAVPQDAPAIEVLRYAKEAEPCLPVVLLFDTVNDAIAHQVASVGVVCGVLQPVQQAFIDDLFRVFKIRVRSRDDSRYFESRSRGCVSATA